MNGLTRSTSADYGNTTMNAGDAMPVSPVQAAVQDLARTQDLAHAQIDALEHRLHDVLGKSLGKLGAEDAKAPQHCVPLLDQLQCRQLSSSAINARLASILERLVV